MDKRLTEYFSDEDEQRIWIKGMLKKYATSAEAINENKHWLDDLPDNLAIDIKHKILKSYQHYGKQ